MMVISPLYTVMFQNSYGTLLGITNTLLLFHFVMVHIVSSVIISDQQKHGHFCTDVGISTDKKLNTML